MITDSFLQELLKPNTLVRIERKIYHATVEKDFGVGDMVLDREDDSYAVIDAINNHQATVRTEFTVEDVPLSRLIKLKLLNEN